MANTLLVATRKGLFHFVRAGAQRWEIDRVSFLGDSVSMVLHDPRDAAIYAGLGLGHFGVKLRKSNDGGATWKELPAPAFPKAPEGHVEQLPDGRPWPWRVEQIWELSAGHLSRPGELWCGTIGGALFKSNDAGASWQFQQSLWNQPRRKEWFGGGADLPGIHSVHVSPADANRVVVGVSCGGVWHSNDGGSSWQLAARGMRADFMPPEQQGNEAIQDPHRLALCREKPSRVWAQHHNGVFRSDDGGFNWVELKDVPPSVFGFAVVVHPSQPDTAWLVPAVKDEKRVPADGAVVVSRTRDGGKSWQVLKNGLPQQHAYDLVYRHALDVDESGARLAFGSTTGSLWVSENEGDAWVHLNAHLPPIYAVRFGAPA